MKLQYRKYGETDPAVVILHGFLGSSDNWHGVAKALSFDCTVYTLDQRNHGRSPHSAHFTYPDMVADLIEFLDDVGLKSVVLLGHSMGGKTAMFAATSHPERIWKLIVADMGVKRYSENPAEILDVLRQLPVEKLATRREADALLAQKISDLAVRQLLLKNLARKRDGRFFWRIPLQTLRAASRNILIALPDDARFEGPVLFIRGEKSPYIRDEDVPEIRQHFPKMSLKTIPNAGHWLHVEAFDAFVQAVHRFIFEN